MSSLLNSSMECQKCDRLKLKMLFNTFHSLLVFWNTNRRNRVSTGLSLISSLWMEYNHHDQACITETDHSVSMDPYLHSSVCTWLTIYYRYRAGTFSVLCLIRKYEAQLTHYASIIPDTLLWNNFREVFSVVVHEKNRWLLVMLHIKL